MMLKEIEHLFSSKNKYAIWAGQGSTQRNLQKNKETFVFHVFLIVFSLVLLGFPWFFSQGSDFQKYPASLPYPRKNPTLVDVLCVDSCRPFDLVPRVLSDIRKSGSSWGPWYTANRDHALAQATKNKEKPR